MIEKTCANCKHRFSMTRNMHYMIKTAYCEIVGKTVRKRCMKTTIRPCCEFENEFLKNKDD